MVVKNTLQNYSTVMSWSKESAAAGLGGLTPGEAAVGALMFGEFQYIDNPLPDPSEEYGDLIQVIKVSQCSILSTITVNNVDHVDQCIHFDISVVAGGKA